MSSSPARRRLSIGFLYLLPFGAVAIVAPHALRSSMPFRLLGVALAAAVSAAVWTLVVVPGGESPAADRRPALSGVLLLAPWALVVLLWPGLATPCVGTELLVNIRGKCLLTRLALSGAFY
jgi:hypothetical protein